MEYIRKDLCCSGRWSWGPSCVITGLMVWGLNGVSHVLQLLITMDFPGLISVRDVGAAAHRTYDGVLERIYSMMGLRIW